MTRFILAVDAGSTMTKAVLFDPEGNEVAVARRRNPILFPGPGCTERDADGMWRDLCDAIRELLQAPGAAASEIAAVSLSGYGAGLYLVDERGRAVRPGIMSTDSRATDVVARWTRDDLAHRNGSRIQQRLWAGQPAALLRWLQDHEPRVLAATHAIVFCKDYLRARLCGDVSTDVTDAGLGGLVDITTTAYPAAFYDELGLADWMPKLPRIGASAEIAGRIGNEAAAATGLRAGTPVVRGLVDVCAAAVASGVADPTQLSVIAGTFSINSSLHATPRLDTLPFLQHAYPAGDFYLATEGSATSASNFEWYCKSILGAEAAAAAASEGRSIYEVCGERAAQAMGRRNDILFLPFLFGGPGGAPAGFVGLTAEHDGGDVVRAIFEGIVFAHKLDIDALLAGRDRAPVTSVRLSGGAMRSTVWSQMFADILGMRVEVTQGGESGARGTAMCAAVALGEHASIRDAMTHMVRVERVHEPSAARHAAYARKFEAFKHTTAALSALSMQRRAEDELAAAA